MTWHKRVPLVVVAAVLAITGPDVLGGRRQPERFQDEASLDAHGGDAARRGHTAPHGRRRPSERLPLRVDPRWDLRTHPRPGAVDLFVNHETSKVPFPYNTAAPTAVNGQSDFDNSQVSRLILNQHSAGVLNGSFVIPSSDGFQRFCSNYLATSRVRQGDPVHFFERGVARLFTPARGFVAARHG